MKGAVKIEIYMMQILNFLNGDVFVMETFK